MLTIWGRITSINVRKAVWCAQELAVPFERIDVGGAFGGNHTPAYLAMNPNGSIPTMVDGEGPFEVTLYESNVIVRYLCARYASGSLYPAGLAARFDAERWMDWQQTTLNPAGRDGFIQWVRTAPAQRDAATYLQSVAATEPLLALLDAHLARQAFMAGDSFTMADIPVACEIHRWRALPLSDTAPVTPHLDRWYQVVSGRPTALGVLDQALT